MVRPVLLSSIASKHGVSVNAPCDIFVKLLDNIAGVA